VAVFALACIMVFAGGAKQTPDAVFARGIGNFMRILGIPMSFAVTFGLLAFSSFVFDTMDVCTRLGRYVLQELTGLRGLTGGIIATAATIAVASAYLWASPPGSFTTFWTIFGTSNQLLAALALVAVSIWLKQSGRRYWFVLLPAIFMLISTCTALVMNFRAFLLSYQALKPHELHLGPGLLVNMGVAVALFILAGLIVGETARVWQKKRVETVSVVA
jgi:carbon starvation protein